jgi:hypothetical protein
MAILGSGESGGLGLAIPKVGELTGGGKLREFEAEDLAAHAN